MLPNNRLEKFLRFVPGEKRSVIKDMYCSLDQHGDFGTIKGIDVIINSIINIILTFKKTYVFDPSYGSNLLKYIYQPADDITKKDIESELNSIIGSYESRGNITHSVSFLENKKGFNISLFVEYEGENKTSTITLDESLLKVLEV